jgi:hypothetical protein
MPRWPRGARRSPARAWPARSRWTVQRHGRAIGGDPARLPPSGSGASLRLAYGPSPRAVGLVPARPHGSGRGLGEGAAGVWRTRSAAKESAMLQDGQLAPSVAVTSARTRRGVPPGPSENARDRISQKALLLGPPGTTGGDVRSPGLPVGGPANPLGFSFPAYRLSVRCIGPYPRRLRR